MQQLYTLHGADFLKTGDRLNVCNLLHAGVKWLNKKSDYFAKKEINIKSIIFRIPSSALPV
jgi:hypothetical protein